MLNKTKAAMQGRQCHYTKLVRGQNTTLIDQVNRCDLYRIAGGVLTPPLAEFDRVCISDVTGIPVSVGYQALPYTLEYYESFVGQTFGLQSAFNWYLICFSWSLNSFLSSSSSAFKALYFSVRPLSFITEIADSSCCGSFKFVGKIEPRLPVISAALCLQSTVAGHSHVIPIWPATSKTTTSYRSVLLLLSAENVYSMTFLRSDILVWVIGGQSLDSLLSRFKRCEQASFTQELNCPSPAASSTCCNRASSNRMFFIVLPERSNLCLELFSCIGRYHGCKLEFDGTYRHFQKQLKIAKPGSGGTLTGPLTKPLSEVTIMADIQSTQTRPEFTWRFFALARADLDGEIHRLSVDATTEQEARRILAPHFILSLAARLPVRGHHA